MLPKEQSSFCCDEQAVGCSTTPASHRESRPGSGDVALPSWLSVTTLTPPHTGSPGPTCSLYPQVEAASLDFCPPLPLAPLPHPTTYQ